MSTCRPRGTDSAQIVQVIMTTALVGYGVAEDPCYTTSQYWTMEGKYIGATEYPLIKEPDQPLRRASCLEASKEAMES